jgi:hypothetical protein
MREFTKLSPRIWHSKGFQALSHREQLQYLFLYGGPHQNSSGCFYVSAAHASADLKCKTADYLRTNLKLVSCELIRFDEDTSEVMIEEWFRSNAPMNDRHRVGTLKLIGNIASNELRALSLERLESAWLARARLAKKVGA